MDLALTIILAICNLIVYFAIKHSLKGVFDYRNGMILGMHVPKESIEDQDLVSLVDKYKKRFRVLNKIVLFGVVFTIFLIWYDTEIFIRVFMVWIMVICAYSQFFSTSAMRSMYSLKETKGWINSDTKNLVKVDTRVSAMRHRMYINPNIHLAFILIFSYIVLDIFMKSFIYRSVFKDMTHASSLTGANDIRMTLVLIFGLGLFIAVTYYILHKWHAKKANIVYCDNTDINYRANMVDKWYWSFAMLIGGVLNLVTHVYMLVAISMKGWIYNSDIIIYIGILTMTSIVTIYVVKLVDTKRDDILRLAKDIEYVDDDYYWRKGYYYNPDSKKLMVQDRFSSTNLTFNMAKKSAKVINIGLGLILVGSMVLVFSLTSGSNNIELVMNGDRVSVSSSFYKTSFDLSDIEEMSLVDDLKDTSVIRTNGVSIGDIDIGHYLGKKEGKLMLYINSSKRPLLKIKLKDRFVYISSDDDLDVKKIYDNISSKK